ncbi:MAG: GNAT family N-acetyltransferase [Thermoleophilia bacterium]|nr:GNAT family N-acetyltransferase [Thermoleophilia bacterium]
MTAITIDAVASTESLRAEWDALADRTECPPFLYGGFIDAWASAFHGPDALRILTARDGAELVGVLPLVINGDVAQTPPRFGQAGAVSLDESVSRALLAHALAQMDLRTIEMGPLPAGGTELVMAQGSAESAGFAYTDWMNQEQPVVDCDTDWETYFAGLSRNLRKDVRRRRRRLEERGELTIEVHRGADALGERLAEGVAIENSGWKGQEGTAILAGDGQLAFYEALADWTAARDALEITFLRLDGAAVAFHYNIVFHGILYALKIGFDEAHADLSPGKVLLGAEIERTFAEGRRRFDFGGDPEDYKLKWATGTPEFRDCRLETQSVATTLSRAARGAAKFARRIRSDDAPSQPADGMAGRKHRT